VSGLKALQNEFAAAMLRGDPSIGSRVVSDADASAGERLEIYADAYVARLQEALEVDFPGLLAYLGDEFYRLTRDYIREHPSQHPSIRWCGRHLPGYIAATNPWCDDVELVELAAFEWAKNEVFDAAESPLATIEQLAAVPPEQWGDLRIEFIPALRRLDLRSNAIPRWRAREQAGPLNDLRIADIPTGWLVWRKGFDPHWRSLEVDEAWAIGQCMAGENFAALCAGLCEWVDEANAPLRAVSLLKSWLADEMLAAVAIPE
jgi:hypothetical protein